MDITNEASIDPFSIGPTTFMGRTIAFRILFCKSLSHLRDQILKMLLRGFYKLKKYLRNYLSPLISLLNPKNRQGVLVMVAMMSFLIRRYTNGKGAMANERKFWSNMMKSAVTYDEWLHAAKMLDKRTQRKNEADLYDEELVRNKLQDLRRRREECSTRDIMFYMRADLIRNLGNMCNPELHKGRLHVPKLIKEYIDEVTTQLKMVCDSDHAEELIPLEEKLSFMHETRHAFGRTALLLSGGASLGAFHVGVVKTLVEHKLLPRIIAGSSVGSAMCAVLGTRSWPELQIFFEDSWLSIQFFDQLGGIFTVSKRIMMQGAVHDIRHLQTLLRNLTNNLTFQEAYDTTGRILGITVCSPRKHEPPRCLNYLTSPHVVIWSAVTASCAFPGLYEAQELMAKDRSGNIVPYHPPFHLDPEEGTATAAGRRWRDGSLEIDLPIKQLKELFNVNQFIVSQANPHIAPLLRLKQMVRTYGGNFAAKIAQLAEMEVKHRCNQILELGVPLGRVAKLFAQDWEGDITVFMPATLAQLSKVIQNPSFVELKKSENQGRRCTWEKLSAIKANCAIEQALDECVAVLNHARRLKKSAERATVSSSSHALANTVKFNASKRIPSWNVIARENSTGSLDQDDLTGRNFHHKYDGSDSESETVDLSSLMRSSGPLMEVDSTTNKEVLGHSLSYGGSSSDVECDHSSSIVVAEGDLLRTEQIDNSIVFNVVRRSILTPSNGLGNNGSPQDSVDELVQHECPENEMDDSPMSENGGDGDGEDVLGDECDSSGVRSVAPAVV
ncbi:hypothetical protein ACS0TY_030991 [Phlomoides rotata]